MDTRTVDYQRWMILGAAVFLALAWNAITQKRYEPREPVPQMTVAEARAAIDAGAVVIDVRDAAVAATSHVNGALLIPLEALHSKLPALEALRAQQVVVYCGDGSTRGPVATALLNKAGFSGAANMSGGIEGWRAAGFPTSAT